MTAINVIRQNKCVYILSDGVFCDNSGIICELGPNAFALPQFPAAIAIRGPTHFIPFLMYRLNRECQSFDDLLARIIPMAVEVYLSFPMMLGTFGYGNIDPDFGLVVAGWSNQRQRFASFVVVRRSSFGERNTIGWELFELPDVMVAPPLTENPGEETWRVPLSAERFCPREDGVKLLKAQRLSKGQFPEQDTIKPRGYGIGGFVQLTTITQSGVAMEILHRWSDRIGEKIA
jgi:hypothetical protein